MSWFKGQGASKGHQLVALMRAEEAAVQLKSYGDEQSLLK